jgi:hypothetical protein
MLDKNANSKYPYRPHILLQQSNRDVITLFFRRSFVGSFHMKDLQTPKEDVR